MDNQLQSTMYTEDIQKAEKSLQNALEGNDIIAIAHARAKFNELKIQQLTQQANVKMEQLDNEIDQQEQTEKANAIEIYSDYLKTGKISIEDLRNLVKFDKELTHNQQIDYRLEAIAGIRNNNNGISFDSYEQVLESVNDDINNTSKLLDIEYYQMSSGMKNLDKINDSKQSMELSFE